MPVIGDSDYGEWVIVRQEFDPARTGRQAGESRWSLEIRYVPEGADQHISARDIKASFDGSPIPFIFNEEDQVLETAVTALFGPPLIHEFALVPAEGSSLPFPSFNLVIR